jgi:hypothetical protein
MVLKLQNHIVQLESEIENHNKNERMNNNQENLIDLYNSEIEEYIF